VKVKRYEGSSEAVLMPIIKEEMGEGATIISVKQKPKSGLFGFFKKQGVIVTAACEDDVEFMNLMQTSDDKKHVPPLVERKPLSVDVVESNAATGSSAIEESMTMLLKEARKAANQMEQGDSAKRKPKAESSPPPKKKESSKKSNRGKKSGVKPAEAKIETKFETRFDAKSSESAEKKYKHNMVQLFFDTMIGQEVMPDVAAHILRDLENMNEDDQIDVQLLIKAVYGSIVDLLKGPTLIDTTKDEKQVVVFMGPTGVGKTTTIAKLSSVLTLQHGLKVGLITADTYRIAAVEQLKTYAAILGLDIRVVYSPEEMEENLRSLKAKNDIVLVDTAGRSHKHSESIGELKALLDVIPDSKKYLVLSVTTRYNDLCKIVNIFDRLSDFNLIFTKLDESETLGSLMNICCIAGKKAAYVTFGQSVPDDLESIKPDKIAKSLLGLGEGGTHPYAEGGNP